ncbi:hypothetical protein GCM10023088_62970 [Actinomadura verrucosospora]
MSWNFVPEFGFAAAGPDVSVASKMILRAFGPAAARARPAALTAALTSSTLAVTADAHRSRARRDPPLTSVTSAGQETRGKPRFVTVTGRTSRRCPLASRRPVPGQEAAVVRKVRR